MSTPRGPRGPQVQEATVWVNRTFKSGGEVVGEDQVQEPIEVRVFQTVPAMVEAKLGRTINLGNYESIRLEVGVSYPCYREEVDDGTALDYVTGIVGGFLMGEIEALKAQRDKGNL